MAVREPKTPSAWEPDDTLIWAGKRLRRSDLGSHYAVLGTVGSGKTLTIQMLMRSVLGDGPRPRRHAVIYDPKLENYPLLCALYGAEHIKILHPFDARCKPWKICRDVRTRAQAEQTGSVLCPSGKNESQPFFSLAAQDIAANVMNSFRLRELDWSLNDVVEGTWNLDTLRSVLRAHPDTEDSVEQFEKQEMDVHATLRANIKRVATAAASWGRSPGAPFSIVEWLEGDPSIVLVPSDPEHSEAIDPINRALFMLLAQRVMSQPAGEEKETWFFLDEVRLAGKLEIKDLLLKGRSKKVHVVLGLQDVLGLRDVYGDKLADEFLGNCSNVAILRLNTPETARWACQYTGSNEVRVDSPSNSKTKPSGGSWSETKSVSSSINERKEFLEQEFGLLQVPSESAGRGFDGVFTTLNDRWIGHVDSGFIGRHLFRSSGQVSDPPVKGFEPVPGANQERLRWADAQWQTMTTRPETDTSSTSLRSL